MVAHSPAEATPAAGGPLGPAGSLAAGSRLQSEVSGPGPPARRGGATLCPPRTWAPVADDSLRLPLNYKMTADPAAAAAMDTDTGIFHRPRSDLSHLYHHLEGRRYAPGHGFRSPHWPELALRPPHLQRQGLDQGLGQSLGQSLGQGLSQGLGQRLDQGLGQGPHYGVYGPLYAAHAARPHKTMIFSGGHAVEQRVPAVAAPDPALRPQHRPFPGWGMAGMALGSAGTALGSAGRRGMQMLDASPLALNMVAQEGSAFQRVVRSCSDLRFLPPPSHKATALHSGEKGALIVSKKELDLSPLSDRHDDDEESADDCKLTSDIGLPFKKRKPRLDKVKMELTKEDNPVYVHLGGDHYEGCICRDLLECEGSVSLAGKFNSWSSRQAQMWLWKTLREHKFSENAICKTLLKVKEENGFDLSTFTKDLWKEKLSDCDEPSSPVRMWEFVWECVMERSRDTSLRPHNYSVEPLSREVDMLGCNMFSHYTTGGNMSAPHGNISLSKKLNKPPRRRRDKCVGQLWEFVYNLLQNKDMEHVVRWEDKEKQLFRIVNTEEIARLWGNHKGNGHMTYANMSRTMRYYREGNGAFVRNERKRVYGFGPKANLKRLEAKVGRKLVK